MKEQHPNNQAAKTTCNKEKLYRKEESIKNVINSHKK